MGKLVQARLLQLFVDDNGRLVRRVAKGKAPAGAVCEGRTNNGYYRVRVDGVYHLVHRVLWTMRHGDIPAGILVDHRDGDGYNNSTDNLRLATHGQNMHNAVTHTGNTSGHRGVHWSNAASKWQVQCNVNGRNHYGGLFLDYSAACAAADTMRIALHGKFAGGNYR